MKTFKTISLSLAALFVATSVANATTISYGPTSFGPFASGSTGGFSFPQFDPSLGTLTQVDLYVTGNSNGGTNAIQNLSDNTGFGSATIGTNITVSGPSALVVLTTPASINSGPVTANVNPPLNFSGSDSIQVIGSASTDSDSDSITTGFAPYLGVFSVFFSYSSASNTTTGSDFTPNVSQATSPTFDFTTTVVYTYSPVPEPSTFVLGGLGLLSLVGLARRKTR